MPIRIYSAKQRCKTPNPNTSLREASEANDVAISPLHAHIVTVSEAEKFVQKIQVDMTKLNLF